MTPQTLLYIGIASTVLGTLGGALEKTCTPGSAWYKAGVFLASLGIDLASLSKLGGSQ